ncbi:hypothetical protein K469DRAFT_773937 [Zopfia rhizophila CBS 207.26]|uniref:Uncharacterized protein n=1 Tax=Zopfia rhizophila CBS 207.26 TaxID=1314779 RepID=A0A6A6ETI8_9PEZI|nr:hypothetical protein K469DRAFT_773937 [Zopfia rhizophila CBS 207.26]
MAPGSVVFLNNVPGVGKLTIARVLKDELLGPTARLIDNHLLKDPAEAISPGQGPAYKALLADTRRVPLDCLEQKIIPSPEPLVIITG